MCKFTHPKKCEFHILDRLTKSLGSVEKKALDFYFASDKLDFVEHSAHPFCCLGRTDEGNELAPGSTFKAAEVPLEVNGVRSH